MSEVKRYASDPCNFRFLTWVAVKHGGSELADVVVAQEFDRVTAELDTARETLERWYRLNVQREAKVDALQQRLTAADERADALLSALELVTDGGFDSDTGSGSWGSVRITAEDWGRIKAAQSGGKEWQSWDVGNTVRYQGSGQDGEDCYCRMSKGSDYLIHEAPDDHESMVVLDDDGDELCVLVGEFKWIKP